MHFFCDYFSMALQMAKKEQTPRDKRPNGVCENRIGWRVKCRCKMRLTFGSPPCRFYRPRSGNSDKIAKFA
jgi:hypothetical protein